MLTKTRPRIICIWYTEFDKMQETTLEDSLMIAGLTSSSDKECYDVP